MANVDELQELIKRTMIECCAQMEDRIVAKVVTALRSDSAALEHAPVTGSVAAPLSPAHIQQVVHDAVQEAPLPRPDVNQFVPIAAEPTAHQLLPPAEPQQIRPEPQFAEPQPEAEYVQQAPPQQQYVEQHEPPHQQYIEQHEPPHQQYVDQQPILPPEPPPEMALAYSAASAAPHQQPQQLIATAPHASGDAAHLKATDAHKFPAYIEGPPSLVYRPDGSVLFEAMVSSKLKEPPVVRWFFRGREIFPDDRYVMKMKKMVGKFAINLIIKNPTQQDQGVYTVFAANSHGSSTQAQTYVQECVGKSFYKD